MWFPNCVPRYPRVPWGIHRDAVGYIFAGNEDVEYPWELLPGGCWVSTLDHIKFISMISIFVTLGSR